MARGSGCGPGSCGAGPAAGRPQVRAEQDGRLSQGEVRTRKRMAAAGAVFALTPVPRTAGDILGPGPRPAAARRPRING